MNYIQPGASRKLSECAHTPCRLSHPRDPSTPSPVPFLRAPARFLPTRNQPPLHRRCCVPNRAYLLETHPSNHHPRPPTFPHPTPNSYDFLLTTASSWGAWSPTTSITGHLEAKVGEEVVSPWHPLTCISPEEQLGNIWLQRGNSLLNPTNPTRIIQREKT